MANVQESIDINVPVRTAYNQWTQFEEFPRFMEGVEEVRQLDDTHVHWVAEIGGHREEWDAEITEQIPDERVAWRAIGGKANAGAVTFHKLDGETTRVMLQMDWKPEGIAEKAGELVGMDSRRIKGDLERFRELMETRGRETGAWRGEVRQDHGADAARDPARYR